MGSAANSYDTSMASGHHLGKLDATSMWRWEISTQPNAWLQNAVPTRPRLIHSQNGGEKNTGNQALDPRNHTFTAC